MSVITFLILIVLISMLLGYAALILAIPVLIFAIIAAVNRFGELPLERKKQIAPWIIGAAVIILAGMFVLYMRSDSLVSGGVQRVPKVTWVKVWLKNDSWITKYAEFSLSGQLADGSNYTTTSRFKIEPGSTVNSMEFGSYNGSKFYMQHCWIGVRSQPFKTLLGYRDWTSVPCSISP